ncbi:non-hydrolyzing UDP-N-acetylglucosamine 2-epimerase [Bradyrhizobium sp. AUGA SZCCT0283]|uniref:non-hydrolyzing UDP-N-acetylglucosamine 2-epimerase n=1 Tax=Bradyrhizobium sp. AUGA SZCCT0283 TaxID=2807671 RepID=UPI001BA85609|nr:UDP-N-acetylglucosamine 2-epimerase (non-hydrolyzing) [Bradyrhizobium sp. AUGA SZCCT0283]MBR1280042.1 UDP-N-acetylglucosamine 2-epimerase (non-hydrolyzing) [Bradyrhizobium sp. AUGA SZCCT0283]
MKIAILVGTRPEIIKMAPVIRECRKRKLDYFIIHSKQHYSEKLDGIFFSELDLPAPKYNLNVGSGGHANQTGRILITLEPILMSEQPDVLLVQGDTNTVVAGALAANKLHIKVGHIEAGLRSFDQTMPEESNRIIADHISDYLFAVTDLQVGYLKSEGLPESKIFKVGNTIVDALLSHRVHAEKTSQVVSELKLQTKGYYLLTSHRAANVDDPDALKEIIELIGKIPGQVCWPIHYRTQKVLKESKIDLPGNLAWTDPVGYSDFLSLLSNCTAVITDSGGVQEEACILGVPCVTIRDSTERPETVDVGANVLVHRNAEAMVAALNRPMSPWTNPFGDGHTAERIIDIIMGQHVRPVPQTQDTVCVVGLGYMGLPTSLLLAKAGVRVTGFDLREKKVIEINSGRCPFEEHGISELLTAALKTGNFKAQTKPATADVFVVAVPTPHDNKKCDLSFVVSAVNSLLPVMKNGNLLIIESTIKPKTCEDVVLPILQSKNLKVEVAHCPERAIPGNTLHEIVHNDRIIGATSPEAAQRAARLYSTFTKGASHQTNLVTAECVKLMENTFRDVNIALANEFSLIADKFRFSVSAAIKLANKHPRVNILQPGIGVGGHCIAVDPWFLTEDIGELNLIRTARTLNDEMPKHTVGRIQNKISPAVKKIGILGVSYKPDVDDARETPALAVAKLLSKKYKIRCHDPFVKDWDLQLFPIEEVDGWADVLVILSNHKAYASRKFESPLLSFDKLINADWCDSTRSSTALLLTKEKIEAEPRRASRRKINDR